MLDRPWSPSPSSTWPPWPRDSPRPTPWPTPPGWPGSSSSWATGGCGWPSTTGCRRWPVRPRPCSSATWPTPPPRSAWGPAGSCCPTTPRWSSPSSSPPWRPSTRVASTSASAAPRAPTRSPPAPSGGWPTRGRTPSPRTSWSSSTTWPTATDRPPHPAPVPGRGYLPEVWLLGSSTFSAQLAGLLGLPFSFAYHFAPDLLDQAVEQYRTAFRPSVLLAEPYSMPAVSVLCAPTEEEARWLAGTLGPQHPAAPHRPARAQCPRPRRPPPTGTPTRSGRSSSPPRPPT